MAVRKHLLSDMSLEELAHDGLFDAAARTDPARDAAADADLEALLDAGDLMAFLNAAVTRRKTIVISGGTGSGKTTLLNALVKEIARTERLVVIEDAPEVRLDHPERRRPGRRARRAGRGPGRRRHPAGGGPAPASRPYPAGRAARPRGLRLPARRQQRPSRARITTVHADSPAGALDQIALLALTSGVDLGWDKVQAYVARVVDVVVQLDRTAGARRLTEVLFRPGSEGTLRRIVCLRLTDKASKSRFIGTASPLPSVSLTHVHS